MSDTDTKTVLSRLPTWHPREELEAVQIDYERFYREAHRRADELNKQAGVRRGPDWRDPRL